jgi:hypothetical protein
MARVCAPPLNRRLPGNQSAQNAAHVRVAGCRA